MRRSKRSIEVEPTLKNHHHFFWGGPCLIPDKFGASTSSISDRKWRGPRGHSAELPCGFSRLEGLQPTGSLRQAELVVGMLVWVIYTIYTMYIYETWAFWKKPKKMKVLGFCKVFFFAYCNLYCCRLLFEAAESEISSGDQEFNTWNVTTFFDQLNLQQPQDFQTLLGLSYVWWSKSFRQEHCTPIFSELKVRQSFSLRKRDRFEYLLCPSCFVVLCQSFPTMAESCVRYVRSFPSIFSPTAS